MLLLTLFIQQVPRAHPNMNMDVVTLTCNPTQDDYKTLIRQWRLDSIRTRTNAKARANYVTHVKTKRYPKSNILFRQWTYKSLANSMKAFPQGLWILEDLHVVDNDTVLLLAWLKLTIVHGRPVHVILSSHSALALEQWGHYLFPAKIHWGPRHEDYDASKVDVQYAPEAAIALIHEWILRRFLDGDMLVFASSIAHRDALVNGLKEHPVKLCYPIVAVTDTIPEAQEPRILIGTSCMDFVVTPQVISKVQRVIDGGTTFYLRQDTGNDWDEGVITRSMAQRRLMYISSAFQDGECLRLYDSEAVLSNEDIATPRLNVSLCRARILVKCGHKALRDFPLPCVVRADTPFPLANLMQLVNVEMPVAHIIHQSIVETQTPDLGIAVAAIVARHYHPFPVCNYESCRRGELPRSVVSIVDKWAGQLGRRQQQVMQQLRGAPWDRVHLWVEHAYQDNMVYKTGIRDLYIHVNTGEILSWRFPYSDSNGLLYTHRNGQEVLACLPIHTDRWHLRKKILPSPLTFVNGIQVRAMESYFESHHVVACLGDDPRQVTVWYLDGKEPTEVILQWMDIVKQKALHTPMAIALPGNTMSMIVTAGFRFSDAVTKHDSVIVGYDPTDIVHSRSRLEKINALHGRWHPEKHTVLLPRRDLMEQTWRDTSPCAVKKLSPKKVNQPSRVEIKLLVRTFTGKSTGRALIQCPSSQWEARVDSTLNWSIFQNTIAGIDLTWDEIDIARHLHIDHSQVWIERQHCLMTHCPHVMDMYRRFKEMGVPGNIEETFHYQHKMEILLNIPEAFLQHALDVIAELPPMSPVVNQPIRVFWRIYINPGSLPPKYFDASEVMLIVNQSHVIPEDLKRLQKAIHNAKLDAEAMTPLGTWMPSLVAPWIQFEHKNVEHTGPEFRIYGSATQKYVLKEALGRLKDRSVRRKNDVYDTCSICWEPEAFYELKVCHCKFCINCLVQHYEHQCLDSTFLQDITCPNPSCNELVGVEDLEYLVRPDILETRALRMTTVLSKRIPHIIRHCPVSGCGFIKRSTEKSFPCEQCHKTWCLRCTDHFHAPTAIHYGACEDSWNVEDVQLTRQEALKAGAKACPVCNMLVVKDGGCNHIACTEPGCLCHWCWKCNQAFTNNKNSAPARGLVEHIRENGVTVRVVESTWVTSDMVPCPDIVRYGKEQATAMRVDTQSPLDIGTEVWVYSYIYDHLDLCLDNELVA